MEQVKDLVYGVFKHGDNICLKIYRVNHRGVESNESVIATGACVIDSAIPWYKTFQTEGEPKKWISVSQQDTNKILIQYYNDKISDSTCYTVAGTSFSIDGNTLVSSNPNIVGNIKIVDTETPVETIDFETWYDRLGVHFSLKTVNGKKIKDNDVMLKYGPTWHSINENLFSTVNNDFLQVEVVCNKIIVAGEDYHPGLMKFVEFNIPTELFIINDKLELSTTDVFPTGFEFE